MALDDGAARIRPAAMRAPVPQTPVLAHSGTSEPAGAQGGMWPGGLSLGLALACVVGAGLGWMEPAFAGIMAALLAISGLRLLRPGRRAPTSAVVLPPEPVPGVRDGKVKALVAALPEPALLLTPEAEIVVANARVALSLGTARPGDPLSFVVRVPEVLEAVRASTADGLPRRVEFAERVPLDRWLEAHVVPLRLDAAAGAAGPDGVLLTFRDLTQQRRVEQMRADFVANASHELRTPLASLSGFIETLEGPARNDAKARERFLPIMAAQARRMSRLIDDLLSLSRIELNAHVRPESPVDPAAILSHVCDTLALLARDRQVVIVQDYAPGLTIRGDRDELIRLFENLVENALKYGASGKTVEVSLAAEAPPAGRQAVVRVRDHGPGIPPEHLPRLTERFYRVDAAASREKGGTGLGLAIVKHIVARHRGRMSIESTPGKGATFTVRLPAVES